MIFEHAEPVEHLPGNRYWFKPLPDGTTLEGVVGDGSHTHVGPGFVSIKDESTGRHIHWNVPMTESQRDFYGTGNHSCPY